MIPCLFLVVFILCGGICNALAKDNFYIKGGLYVQDGQKCYNVKGREDISGSGDVDDLYIRTKNGTVFEIYTSVVKYVFLKTIKKDGDLYTVLLGLKPGARMGDNIVEKDTYVYKIQNDTSFSILRMIDETGVQDRSFKPITYKYCGDQHLFDAQDEYEMQNNSSQSNTTSSQKQNPKQLTKSIAGTWSGYFPVKNSNGKSYMLNMTYVITRDSANSGMYHFTQTSFLKFDNPTDVFGCSNTNAYSNTYQGDIIEEQVGYKFIQKTVSNPKCGTTDVDLYQLNGDRFNAVNVNGGKITSGYLTKN